ncbi:MAG TPA: extracellular solute-binding protein [Tepidisphaeraceae bacterium]|nr:extracellular solute-binding protein [Tepidisphaeraceae bacterium]
MRRYVFLILFLFVLVTPFALRRLYGTAKEANSSGRELVILSSHVEGIRREFAEAFCRWHEQNFGQPVNVVYLNYGGSADILKYFRNSEQTIFKSFGTYKIDLVWGGGDYLFENQLKYFVDENKVRRPGCLESIKLPDETMRFAFPKPMLNGIQLYDTHDNTWFGTALSSFGICYNKDVCRTLGVDEPKTWGDLSDARWSRWVVMADPSSSTSAGTAFMIVVERAMLDAKAQGRSEDQGWAEGMGRVRLIASNAKMFTDSAAVVPSLIGAGDAGAGMVIDFYGRSQVEAVGSNRMGYLEPAGATAINPDPIAMVRGAEHRELAMRFIEFVLSEQGQKLWNTRAGAPGGPSKTSLRRLPIAPSVYNDRSNFTDPVDPFTGNLAFDTSNARRKTFPILGELIRMSCIDLLDDLRETRAEIDRAGRKDLEAKLGMFPFDQAEALRRLSAWSRATPLERIALEQKWKAEFREEYRRLREEAEKGEMAKDP